VSTDADAGVGPVFDLTRNSASPAADDGLAQIRFNGKDSGGNELSYAHLRAFIVDPTDGSEDGRFEIDVREAGGQRSRLLIDSTETAFNQESRDFDFRVESDANSHMLFVDAGNDSVGIGTSSAGSFTIGDLVVGDGAGARGITIFAATDNEAIIRFADGTSGDQQYRGQIKYNHAEDSLNFHANGASGSAENLILKNSEAVFNEGGIDTDFRVESDGNANMLFVDGGTNRVGVGNAAPSTMLEVTGNGDADTGITTTHTRSGVGFTLSLNNTNNGTDKGSGIKWKSGGFTTGAIITRSDAVAASGDAPAYMTFHTSADGTEDLTERLRLSSTGAATFSSTVISGSTISAFGNGNASLQWGDTSAIGYLSFDGSGNAVVRSGSGAALKIQVNASRDVATFSSTETVFNEPGNNQDFRVESDSNANMLFVDAGNDAVSIGGSPLSTASLTVVGQYEETSGSGYDYNVALAPDTSLSIAQGKGTGILFMSEDSGSAARHSAHIQSARSSTVASNYTNDLVFSTRNNGSEMANVFKLQGSKDAVFFDMTLDAALGTNAVQITSNNASGTGPELLVHNPGQGSTAQSIITFGGKTSGTEGYTGSIHTTNNDGLFFGAANASDGFGSQPSSFLQIAPSGSVKHTPPDAAEFVVNDSSSDSDFRVESNDNTHLLFVDGTQNRLAVNNSDPKTLVDIYDATLPVLRLTNGRNEVSGSDYDLGKIEFFSRDSSGTGQRVLTEINAIADGGSTAPGGIFTIKTAVTNSAAVERVRFDAGHEVVFNDTSTDTDFRVESDSNANMLFVDAGKQPLPPLQTNASRTTS